MAMPVTASATVANTTTRRLGLLNWCVVPGACAAGSAVVGAVGRLISGVVEVWGRILVSISLDTGAEANFAVFASVLIEPESLIRAAPSIRQNASASSVSTR